MNGDGGGYKARAALSNYFSSERLFHVDGFHPFAFWATPPSTVIKASSASCGRPIVANTRTSPKGRLSSTIWAASQAWAITGRIWCRQSCNERRLANSRLKICTAQPKTQSTCCLRSCQTDLLRLDTHNIVGQVAQNLFSLSESKEDHLHLPTV